MIYDKPTDEDSIITADPDIIVAIIEGLLLSLSITAPSMLDYISDYSAQLREETKKYD